MDSIWPNQEHDRHYKIIGGDPEGTDWHLILDTSVVVDIDRFYRNPKKFGQSPRASALPLFLSKHHHVDMVPCFGLMESAIDRKTEKLDPVRYAQTAAIVERVLQWSPVDIALHIHRQTAGPELTPNPTIADAAIKFMDFVEIMMMSSYASLLKIVEIRSRHDAQARKGLRSLEEFKNWMFKEIGLLFAIEMKIAAEALDGESNHAYVDQLLHISALDLDEIKDAAWDIFFLRLPDFAQGGLLPGGANASLVTSDKAAFGIKKNMNLAQVFKFSEKSTALFEISPQMKNFSAVFASETTPFGRMGIYRSLERSFLEKKEPDKEKVLSVVKSLESTLKVRLETRNIN